MPKYRAHVLKGGSSFIKEKFYFIQIEAGWNFGVLVTTISLFLKKFQKDLSACPTVLKEDDFSSISKILWWWPTNPKVMPNLSEGAMRVLRRGSELATPRADICLVCPETRSTSYLGTANDYLGKRTQSQPNSSKSMVSGHMQHSVVPGSCSSLQVRWAVLLVRALQAARLMSSCM